ncbi:hypothetical protein [Mesorhizobium australicum]|uniref:hypothetical protein n=1 Tax=Mesorhizobium australicum TaxID=536018 RepID=UPI00041E0040
MPIRRNLAANPRRLVSGHASVSAVCRGLGMNRLQFERYLQVGRISLRQAMRMCGVVSLDDTRLDQLVASLARER